MKKCTNCGYVADDNSVCCPACGYAYSAEKKQAHGSAAKSGEAQSAFLKYSSFMDNQALMQIAKMKDNGVGTVQERDEAVEIYKILAFRGEEDAMFRLAEIYLEQTPPNTEAALCWLKIAADGGHKPSIIKLKVLKAENSEKGNFEITLPHDLTDTEARVEEALPYIVTVRSVKAEGDLTRKTAGSGFIIEGGYVITNAHVAGDDPDCITASFEPRIDGKSYNLLPVKIAPEYDVAVLKFTGLFGDRISARDNLTFRLNGVNFGEEVYTVGNPLGMGLSVSHGVISCPNRASDYKGVKEVIQTDFTVNHGNSGGALLDKCNNVLGMITYFPGESEGGITMCVPAKYIVEVLNNIKQKEKNYES